MAREMLQPVIGLVCWTLVMLVWTVATRLPAMRAAGVDLRSLVGTKGSDADRTLAPKTQWKAHNYNHLFEQPVLFYAVVIVLALLGVNEFETRLLAWIYVGLRVVHSVWQATVNGVAARFGLFFAGTAVLVVLTGRAAMAAYGIAY